MARLPEGRLLELQKIIGYEFKNTHLVALAFTHRSASSDSYERLEFLGDSILSLLVCEYLYNEFSHLKEGKLSRIRSSIVCGENLEKISRVLGLSKFIIVGTGSKKQEIPSSLHADLIESLTGAIYLDSNISICRKIIMPLFADNFKTLDTEDVFKDPKTQLQEWLQAQGLPLPKYHLKEMQHKDNQHEFSVECFVECLPQLMIATGTSRRKAEQEVARKTILELKACSLKSRA